MTWHAMPWPLRRPVYVSVAALHSCEHYYIAGIIIISDFGEKDGARRAFFKFIAERQLAPVIHKATVMIDSEPDGMVMCSAADRPHSAVVDQGGGEHCGVGLV